MTCLDGLEKLTIDGEPHIVHKGESIVMPAKQPHAVFTEEKFKMMLGVF